MKFVLAACLLLIFTTNNVSGQPGGGGGIIIKSITDKNGTPINRNDSALTIRKFILSESEGLSVKEYYKSQEESSFPKHASIDRNGLYIRPDIYINNKKVNIPHQLIQLTYKTDTAYFDFEDIKMEDGTGISNYVDTLQIIGGWYKISFTSIFSHYDYLMKSWEPEKERGSIRYMH